MKSKALKKGEAASPRDVGNPYHSRNNIGLPQVSNDSNKMHKTEKPTILYQQNLISADSMKAKGKMYTSHTRIIKNPDFSAVGGDPLLKQKADDGASSLEQSTKALKAATIKNQQRNDQS